MRVPGRAAPQSHLRRHWQPRRPAWPACSSSSALTPVILSWHACSGARGIRDEREALVSPFRTPHVSKHARLVVRSLCHTLPVISTVARCDPYISHALPGVKAEQPRSGGTPRRFPRRWTMTGYGTAGPSSRWGSRCAAKCTITCSASLSSYDLLWLAAAGLSMARCCGKSGNLANQHAHIDSSCCLVSGANAETAWTGLRRGGLFGRACACTAGTPVALPGSCATDPAASSVRSCRCDGLHLRPAHGSAERCAVHGEWSPATAVALSVPIAVLAALPLAKFALGLTCHVPTVTLLLMEWRSGPWSSY